MFKRVLVRMVAAVLGLLLAATFVPGVHINAWPAIHLPGIALTQQWQILLALGIVLGLVNSFIKPAISALATPIILLTFGLAHLIINMGIIFALDYAFAQLSVSWFWPLLWTTILVWLADFTVAKTAGREE